MSAARVAAMAGVALAAALFGVGCGSSEPPPNSFTEVYEKVIVPSCASPYCHYYNVGIRYSALDMSSRTNAYWNLLGQPALGPSCSQLGTRVVPGRPDLSLMYSKVSAELPTCGSRMPANPTELLRKGSSVYSGVPLTEEQQQLIYNWILEGAQNN